MIRNYIKIAWRNFLNVKSYGLINLVGLTVGTVCCLAILCYVQSQFGYEKHYNDHDRIYKVATTIRHTGTPDFVAITASPGMGPALMRNFEEVENQARVVNLENNEFLMKPEDNEKSIFEGDGILADSSFFQLFNFDIKYGDSKTALENPNSIVLSAELAVKLFGEDLNPVGKAIEMSNSDEAITAQITAVLNKTNKKSHLQPNFILNLKSTGMGNFVARSTELATNNFVHTYLKLNENTLPAQLTSKLPDFLEKNAGESLRATSMDKELALVPLDDINLKSSQYVFPLGKVSDIKYLYLLLGIAFFIQLMACINYINLTTAQATRRAKEIGVRKVNGAASKSLVYQFMIESILFSIFSVLLAIPILVFMLPYINDLLNGSLEVTDILSLKMLLITLTLGMFTGIISGSYPALYLSLMNPIKILKKSFKTGKSAFLLRNGLVVFQFVMVFILIYAVSVVTQQLNHLTSKDLGFTQNQKLVIPLKTEGAVSNYEVMKNEFENMAEIDEVTGTQFYPSQNIFYDQKLYKIGQTVDQGEIVNINLARANFFETMDMKLLKGRTFPEADGTQMVVNETFLSTFGININEAIGVRFLNHDMDASDTPYEIVGVIQDYNFLTLKNNVIPVATFYDNQLSNLIVSFNAGNTSNLIANIESKWQAQNPDVPFQFSFLDERMATIYADEQRLKKVSHTFAFLAILISLLGIWGLVSFTTQQRTKEIGVRKVLGASVAEITKLLTKEFVMLAGISILIGIPISIYAMNQWLNSYTYKIENTTALLIFTALCTLIVCLITVVYKTVNAARANPVASISSE